MLIRAGPFNSKGAAQMIGAIIHLCYYLLVLHQKELKVLLSVLVENLEGVSWLGGKTTDTRRGSH